MWQRAFTYSTGGGHVRQPRRRGRQRARDGRQICGDGARAVREGRACLGRVVDRARGACRSKARGLFSYDLATGEFGPAPEGVEGPQRPRRRHGARRVARRRVPARLPPAPGRADGLRRRVRPRRARHRAGAAGVSSHNGQAGEEVRLTCVVRRDTGLPLFCHVAGNATGAPAAARTIAEPGRPQGLRLPAPRLGHAPRARARRHQEGRRGRALGRRGPRPGGPGGVFALAGTRRMAGGKLLPPYHARDCVERVFEIARRGGKALPVCVQTEETLGGRLPVCLVVTAAARMMSDVLASRRTSPAVESMPGVPRERHATGRDGRLVTTEPVRKTSEAHGAFGIRCPDTNRLPVVSQGSAGNSGLLRAGREPWRPQQRSARHSRAGPHQEGVHLHRPAREKLTSGEGVAGQAVPAVL